ncbi:LexA family protein [Cupriavidus sp. a3]|uniref:LexA family protein n=1 Tax=Cupriavidus sp. a3 TaxID=3242158 RepID=UPI003D9C594C
MENPNIPWPLIEEKLRLAGRKQAWLADQLNVGTNVITNWKKRGGAPKARALEIATALGCTADELLAASHPHHPTKEGQSAFSVDPYNDLSAGDNFTLGPDVKGKIPLISWVQAGNWSEVVKGFTEEDAEQWLPALRPMSRRAFALRVEGSSMEPRYQHGDVIYVEPEAHAEHGRRVVVQLENEPEATFKELVIENGHKFLRPLNPDWPGPKFIPINGNATIIGVVVGKWVPE